MSKAQRRSEAQRSAIAKAAGALEHYEDTQVCASAINLLADLRHFADFYSMDFYKLLDASYVSYLADLDEAKKESEARFTTV